MRSALRDLALAQMDTFQVGCTPLLSCCVVR